MIEYQYDREADALYITLNHERYAYGVDLDEERRIDYCSDHQAVGIELLCVSGGVNLQDLPHPDIVLAILNREGIISYNFVRYPHDIYAYTIQNPSMDEENDAFKGGIKKELTGVS